jgi:hypothetical protein
MSNKKLLNEFLVLDDFIYIGLTALAIWAIKKMPGYRVVGKDGHSGLTPEVFNAIPKLYSDKEFIKDFVKILQKESNLEDIVKKSQTDYYKRYKSKI